MGRAMHWMLMPYRRYVDFDGRSQRMEYWMFMLFYYIVFILLFILIFAGLPWGEMQVAENGQPIEMPPGPLTWIGVGLLSVFALGSFIPQISVTVRRFHDQDKTGWLYLLNFIPLGGLVVFVFMCLEGTRGANQYGPDPKDPDEANVFE